MDQNTPLKAASNSYQTPDIAKTLLHLTDPLVISGVTAAGKNTVSQKLCEVADFERVVTNTTRPPRVGEVNGVDYWFCDGNEMFDLIKNKQLIETEVIHDYVYACSIQALLTVRKRNKRPVMTIDVSGAMNLRRLSPDIRPLFLIPPSYNEWMVRLGSRSFLSDGERNRRMHSAHLEIETALRANDFIVTVNNDLEETVAAIRAGIGADPSSQEAARKAARDLFDYIQAL